jgi:hypothetical protein
MTESDILYIHYDHLQHLYKTSQAWERFGRIFAESVLHAVMNNTEAILFKSPEDRYAELISAHPDICNVRSIVSYRLLSRYRRTLPKPHQEANGLKRAISSSKNTFSILTWVKIFRFW